MGRGCRGEAVCPYPAEDQSAQCQRKQPAQRKVKSRTSSNASRLLRDNPVTIGLTRGRRGVKTHRGVLDRLVAGVDLSSWERGVTSIRTERLGAPVKQPGCRC